MGVIGAIKAFIVESKQARALEQSSKERTTKIIAARNRGSNLETQIWLIDEELGKAKGWGPEKKALREELAQKREGLVAELRVVSQELIDLRANQKNGGVRPKDAH